MSPVNLMFKAILADWFFWAIHSSKSPWQFFYMDAGYQKICILVIHL